jgi:hypothetical protein
MTDEPFTRGGLWSFLRSCMTQGQDIALDYRERSYEEMSARLDAAAAKRADDLMAAIRKKISAHDRRCECEVCEGQKSTVNPDSGER